MGQVAIVGSLYVYVHAVTMWKNWQMDRKKQYTFGECGYGCDYGCGYLELPLLGPIVLRALCWLYRKWDWYVCMYVTLFWNLDTHSVIIWTNNDQPSVSLLISGWPPNLHSNGWDQRRPITHNFGMVKEWCVVIKTAVKYQWKILLKSVYEHTT